MRKKRVNTTKYIVTSLALIQAVVLLIAILDSKDAKFIYTGDYLIELNDEMFIDSILCSRCFVLFYTEDSDFSKEMKHNLNQIARNRQNDIRFFKCDVNKHLGIIQSYSTSAIPNIAVFEKGVEIKRIAGEISEHNLNMIQH